MGLLSRFAPFSKDQARRLARRCNKTAAALATAAPPLAVQSVPAGALTGSVSGAAWYLSIVATEIADDPPRADWDRIEAQLSADTRESILRARAPRRLIDTDSPDWSRIATFAWRWSLACASAAYSLEAALSAIERADGIDEGLLPRRAVQDWIPAAEMRRLHLGLASFHALEARRYGELMSERGSFGSVDEVLSLVERDFGFSEVELLAVVGIDEDGQEMVQRELRRILNRLGLRHTRLDVRAASPGVWNELVDERGDHGELVISLAEAMVGVGL